METSRIPFSVSAEGRRVHRQTW